MDNNDQNRIKKTVHFIPDTNKTDVSQSSKNLHTQLPNSVNLHWTTTISPHDLYKHTKGNSSFNSLLDTPLTKGRTLRPFFTFRTLLLQTQTIRFWHGSGGTCGNDVRAGISIDRVFILVNQNYNKKSRQDNVYGEIV